MDQRDTVIVEDAPRHPDGQARRRRRSRGRGARHATGVSKAQRSYTVLVPPRDLRRLEDLVFGRS